MLREVGYCLVDRLEDSRFAVVDADGPEAFDAVSGGRNPQDAVFVGAQAPAGASSWLMRPLDAARVLQELDLMVARTMIERADEQTHMTTITGWPLPASRILSTGGFPMPCEALGRRLGDALGAMPRPGRADRRS